MAIGSVGGALATGARGKVGERFLAVSAAAFGAFALLAGARLHASRSRSPRSSRSGPSASASPPASTRPFSSAPAPRCGAGDGAVLGRLPRLHSDRRAARRLALREAAGPRAGLVLAGVAALRRRVRWLVRVLAPAWRGAEACAGSPNAALVFVPPPALSRGRAGSQRLHRRGQSRSRPGVRISRTGSNADEGSM